MNFFKKIISHFTKNSSHASNVKNCNGISTQESTSTAYHAPNFDLHDLISQYSQSADDLSGPMDSIISEDHSDSKEIDIIDLTLDDDDDFNPHKMSVDDSQAIDESHVSQTDNEKAESSYPVIDLDEYFDFIENIVNNDENLEIEASKNSPIDRIETDASQNSPVDKISNENSECYTNMENVTPWVDHNNIDTNKNDGFDTEEILCSQVPFYGFQNTDFEEEIDLLNLFIPTKDMAHSNLPDLIPIEFLKRPIINIDKELSDSHEISLQFGVQGKDSCLHTPNIANSNYKDIEESRLEKDNYSNSENNLITNKDIIDMNSNSFDIAATDESTAENTVIKNDGLNIDSNIAAKHKSNSEDDLTNKAGIINKNSNVTDIAVESVSNSENNFIMNENRIIENEANVDQDYNNPEDSDDESCGYHSSDFEFITESEAEAEGLFLMSERRYKNKKKTVTTKDAKTNTDNKILDTQCTTNNKTSDTKTTENNNTLPSTSTPKPSTSKALNNNLLQRDYRSMRQDFMQKEADRLRKNHVEPRGQDYLDLFYGPNAAIAQECVSENKSARAWCCMDGQYGGIGLNMRLVDRHDNVLEEERKEAEISAKMILDTYPTQNRKRRRRS